MPTNLTRDDAELLDAIFGATNDSHHCARLLHKYYHDADRADRTPRELMYLHIGLLVGMILGDDGDQATRH
jgi:hypothetical protein